MPELDSSVIFRNVQDFPGYMVGSDGTVWTCWRRGSKPDMTTHWRQLKPQVISHSRLSVTLVNGKVKRQVQLHVLVLEVFVGPRPDGMVSRHFPDRCPTNCRADNLSYSTQKVNLADRMVHGTRLNGEKSKFAKLTEAQVKEIREKYKAGEIIQKELGAMYGVRQGTISFIIRGQTWA